MILQGTPGTILRYTGNGKATNFDGSVTPITNLVFEDFIIDGGSSATHGFYASALNRSRITNIESRNTSQYGFQTLFSILNNFTNPKCSMPIGTALQLPKVLFELGSLGGSNYSSANVIINPTMENNGAGTGINLITSCVHTTVFGGSCEGLGVGVKIGSGTDALSSKNKFFGIDLEANLTDAVVYGFGNSFDSIISLSYAETLTVTGQAGLFRFGELLTHTPSGKTALVMTNSPLQVTLTDTTWEVLVSGTLTGQTSRATATLSRAVPISAIQLTSAAKGTILSGGQYSGRIQERGANNILIGVGYSHALLDSYFNQFIQMSCWDLNGAVSYTTGLMLSNALVNGGAIVVPASGVDLRNTTGYPMQYFTSGGTVTAITVTHNSTGYITGAISGSVMLSPGDFIRWTYTVVPTVYGVPL